MHSDTPTPRDHTWIVVLAAGDGLRLRSVTTDREGRAWPKQYCSFLSEHSLLRQTLQRAERQAPRERIVVVVADRHEGWWRRELADWPAENVIVQPANRGTAVGILLALSRVLERDVRARLAFLPSDHSVDHEEVLGRALRSAIDHAGLDRARLVLLGITPDHPEPGYGWIVPDDAGNGRLPGVARFVEKPEPPVAEQLRVSGALWNSFVFAVQGARLLELYGEHQARLAMAFLEAPRQTRWDPPRLRALYQSLPSVDFSRDLLERSPEAQSVLRVPDCGWTDLGTPDRARACRDSKLLHQPRRAAVSMPAWSVDIAQAC